MSASRNALAHLAPAAGTASLCVWEKTMRPQRTKDSNSDSILRARPTKAQCKAPNLEMASNTITRHVRRKKRSGSAAPTVRCPDGRTCPSAPANSKAASNRPPRCNVWTKSGKPLAIALSPSKRSELDVVRQVNRLHRSPCACLRMRSSHRRSTTKSQASVHQLTGCLWWSDCQYCRQQGHAPVVAAAAADGEARRAGEEIVSCFLV